MNSSKFNSIQQQANDWLVKLETGTMADGDEDRFVEWMEQDEAHSEAFYEAEQIWQTMSQVNAEALSLSETGDSNVVAFETPPVTESETSPYTDKNAATASTEIASSNIVKPQFGWFSKAVMPLAATLLLTFLSAFYGQDVWFGLTADQYAATGELKTQTLPDGSVITLNTETAIKLRFSEEKRVVELLTGEIYVDVFSDQSRPFSVKAGEMQVTALGTEFMVRKVSDSDPVVTVTEHSVRVESLAVEEIQVVLEQGQQVRLIEKRDILTNVEEVDINWVQTWREGRLVFQDEPLQKIVEELNRYTDVKIIIDNKRLESLSVTGVLNLEDPEQSLQDLAQNLGLNLRYMTPYLLYIN